jgi:hypothetical protein
MLLMLESLILILYVARRRRLRRLPAGSIANANAALHGLTRWQDIRNFRLQLRTEGHYLFSVNQETSTAVDVEILCNDDQADALRNLLVEWITEARGRPNIPFSQIRS